MSYQISNNNTFTTAPTSPNPYITRKLNNIEEARMMKKERNDWTKIYHKMLKGIEAMIDVQRRIKNVIKIAAEANMIITEMEEVILEASIDNWVTNATNIIGVSEDLRYLVQSNMENQIFQIQRMLADKLDTYKGKGNIYVDDNVQEIQNLYKEEEVKKEEGEIENEKVILVKPYETSKTTTSSSSAQMSFIMDEVKNLAKYMKFV